MMQVGIQCIMFSIPLLCLLLGFYSYQQRTTAPLATHIDVMGKTHFIVGKTSLNQTEAAPAITHYPLPEEFSYLACPDGSIKYALFAPDDDVQKILLDLIDQEKKSIKIAIFSFTDAKVAQAILDAADRKVNVQIIADDSCLTDRFAKITFLQEHGIPIHIYESENKSLFADIMHNKFIIFEQNIGNRSLLWTGSFNFTQSARKRNQENVVILDDTLLIERYRKQFELLKERIAAGIQRAKLAQSAENKNNHRMIVGA